MVNSIGTTTRVRKRLRHAVTKLQARQRGGSETVGNSLVHQRDRGIQRRDRAERAQDAQPDPVRVGLGVDDDRQREEKRGDERAGADIAADAERAVEAARRSIGAGRESRSRASNSTRPPPQR